MHRLIPLPARINLSRKTAEGIRHQLPAIVASVSYSLRRSPRKSVQVEVNGLFMNVAQRKFTE